MAAATRARIAAMCLLAVAATTAARLPAPGGATLDAPALTPPDAPRAGPAAAPPVLLVVAWCPTFATNAGGVVEIDPRDPTNFKLRGKAWAWPDDAMFGCTDATHPVVSVDPDAHTAQVLGLGFRS